MWHWRHTHIQTLTYNQANKYETTVANEQAHILERMFNFEACMEQ